MSNRIKNIFHFSILAMLLVIVPGIGIAGGNYPVRDRALIIFGDSLSDGGNYFENTGEFSVQPFEFIPSAPYARSGFHFTNGRTWIERVARQLNDHRSGKPALRRPGRFTNYAYGTARSRTSGAGFDLGNQVSLFLSDFNGQAPQQSTYVMWTGANDVRDAINALFVDPSGATSSGILNEAVTATADNIVALYGSGARTFMVANVPNIGLTPAVRSYGSEAEAAALQLSILYNQGLSQALDSLEAFPGIRIVRLDVFEILGDLVDDLQGEGRVSVAESCITPGVIVEAICDRPGRYLFWDGIHPTQVGHRYLAKEAYALLQ
jgi:phospholipase/lecithinase/hemolysin